MANAKVAKSFYRLTAVNLPWTIGDLQLKQYFSQFGTVVNAKVFFDRNTGLSKHAGLVEIADKDTYENILSTQKHTIEERDIFVRKWIE